MYVEDDVGNSSSTKDAIYSLYTMLEEKSGAITVIIIIMYF